MSAGEILDVPKPAPIEVPCTDCAAEQRAGFLAISLLEHVLAQPRPGIASVRLEVLTASDGDQTVSLELGAVE